MKKNIYHVQLESWVCRNKIEDVLFFILFNQTTFHIILSTKAMPLHATEINIELLLQT